MNTKKNSGFILDWRVLLVLCITGLISGFSHIGVLSAKKSENLSPGAPSKASLFTGYYNLMSFEGVGTVGDYGEIPSVGDYVTTYCRFINVQNTNIGDYVLQYPLHLPNGSTITEVAVHLADFNPSGRMTAVLFRRLWNSRNAGTNEAYATSSSGVDGDVTLNMSTFGEINLDIDNENYEYWVGVTMENSTSPGQLCVYGIQVTYTMDGALLPLVVRNN